MIGYFAGVDGGGSHTRAVVADGSGRELARATGPASVADPSRPEISARVVSQLVGEVAHDAGVALPLRGVFAAVAGTGRETVRWGVESALARSGVARKVAVNTDAHAAFHNAFGTGSGILLVAGTGSMGWGRGDDGREARVGGWGTVIGDEGSGYGIGREALRRVARGSDGRGPATGLTDAILSFLELEAVEELIQWAHEATKAQVASLVPVVSAQARAKDAMAAEILVDAVEELEGHVLSLVSSLGPWSDHPRIALTGGLLRPGGPLRSGIETVLARHSLRRTDREPDTLRGAVELALEGDRGRTVPEGT